MFRELKDVRVVALLGNELQHRNTLATLIKNHKRSRSLYS